MTGTIDQARALADAGEINAARTIYKQVLQVEDNNPDLLEEVGFFEVKAGRYPEAIGLMKLALKMRPNDATSHLNMAETYRLSGAGEHAKFHYEEVLKNDPQDADAYFGLANLDVVAEQWASASNNLTLALGINPNDVEALQLHASVLRNLEEWRQAEKQYLRILSLAPNSFDVLVELAQYYLEQNRTTQAIECYLKAEEISPLPIDDLSKLCQSLTMDGRAREAVPIVHKMMLSSNLPESAAGARGEILLTLGMFAEAERDLRTAIKAAPHPYVQYEQLGTIHRLTDKDLERIEQLLTTPDLPMEAQIGYQFALFSGYKDRKQHTKAFNALKRASDLRLQDNPVEPEEIIRSTQNSIDSFNKDMFDRNKSFGYNKAGAIFIVGMPRSGTTLTERVLGAHTSVVARGERYAVSNLADDLEGYPETIDGLSDDAATALGRKLLQDMLSTANGERFATDKMPGNFKHVGLISLLLPNAKVIWCKRNPIDNCLSCFEQHFATGWNFTYSLEGLAVAYRQHERLMRHWIDVCPIPVHTVNYEDLVSEPEPTARAMLEYVGLDWDPSCLNPEDVDSNIATASMWQARQPINTGSVEKWRRYEKQLQPLIKALEEN